MKRATIELELNDGRTAAATITPAHILVHVDGRACLAHNRWFDRMEAAEMARSLSEFAGGQ